MDTMRVLRVLSKRTVFVLLSALCMMVALRPELIESPSRPTSKVSSYQTDWVSQYVPVSLASQLRARALREAQHIGVAEAPADVAPMPPAPLAPIIMRIATPEPVIFITIDDGVHKPEDAAQYLADYQLPLTAFLTTSVTQDNFGYFGRLQQAGTIIQNHTIAHSFLPRHSLDQQRHEVCAAAATLGAVYGLRPTLFRPPYGEYNADTQRAVAECGMRAIVLWSAVMERGVMAYQAPYTHLMPGDIVLLHFRPELKTDIEATVRLATERGLKIGRLEDYLK